MRGHSTFMEKLANEFGNEIRIGRLRPEPGKKSLRSTRAQVVREWGLTAKRLDAQGERLLTKDVRSFASQFPPPRTDREQVTAGILAEIVRRDDRVRPPVRYSTPPVTGLPLPESPVRSR